MPVGSRVAMWLEQLHGPPSDERRRAAERLLKTSEFYFYKGKITSAERNEVIRSVSPLSTNPDTLIRKCVAQLVGLVREWSTDTEFVLRQLLEDGETAVLAPAVWATGHIAVPAASLVPQLVRLAQHPDFEVRFRVPWALGEIKVSNSDVVSALIRLVSDEDRTVRMFALDAMAQCNADPSSVFHTVRSAFNDAAEEVQCAACRVVAALPHDWSLVEPELWRLFRRHSIDAVRAICNNWPERIHESEINAWLQVNRGYWWAEDYLSGISRSPLTARAMRMPE